MLTISPRACFLIFTLSMYDGIKADLTPQQRREIDAMLQTDRSKPPFYHTGNKTDVRITIHITQMRFIDTNEADFTFYYYQIWNDPRLKYPFGNISDIDTTYHVIRNKYFENIWLPESYVENEIHSHVHDSSMPNRFVWITPNGTIIYSMRMTVGLSCDLKGFLFPNGLFDCLLKFRIHSYTNDQVTLEWDSINKPKINVTFANPEVTTHTWEFTTCSSDTSAVVDSSCVQLLVHIGFSFANNVGRLFIPSIFIVLVGWLSFWIERSQVSSRVKLGTLCLLAMITEQVGTKLFLQTDITISAIEVWFVMSLIFVVVAMFEYTFVHAVDIFQQKIRRQEEIKKDNLTEGITDTGALKQMSNVDLVDTNLGSADGHAIGETEGNRSNNNTYSFSVRFFMSVPTGVVEKYFRVYYLAAYAVFQLLFWIFYLHYEEVY
ncbi:glycine receptor subunit alpha-1-like [Argopecten irradians]|uniref:glycine receptor subunit alpha-1-like n=1 Tax=Argopecten irradians TaxID=31199 RepID=UPI0037164B13